MQHSLDYLREALQVWLGAGEKINYSAQDNDILTAIAFMPDAASRDDSRAVARLKISENPVIFTYKSHACIRCIVLHAFCQHAMPRQRQHWRALRQVMRLH